MNEILTSLLVETGKIREKIHQLAELSWEEYKTTRFIKEKLSEWGVPCHPIPGLETGCYVDLKFHPGAPYLLLRSDIDALPVEDQPDLTYCSLTKGVSHACGHDFHAAVGMAAVKIFQKYGSRGKYNVRILFQPAEEPIPGGATKIINTHILDNVERLFAIHVEPKIPIGTISFAEGWVNAQSHRFELHLHGAGGHSARVSDSNNLIKHAARFIEDASEQFPVRVDESKASVLAFTTIHGGEGYNILPKDVTITGTFRTTQSELLNKFLNFVIDYRENKWKSVNIQSDWLLESGAPPVVISESDFRKLERIYFDALTPDIKLESFRSLGGDDFGWYLKNHQGAIIRIGINSENRKGLHEYGFDSGNEALETAIKTIEAVFLNW